MWKNNGSVRRRLAAAFAVVAAGVASAGNALAVDSSIVTDVKTKLTGLSTDAESLGLAFLGIVAVIAVIALARKFLGGHH